MRSDLGYILLTSCVIGIILMVCSFITYIANRKSYNDLLALYRSSHLDFPMPYSFQSMTGFFGAYPVSRFFLNIKRRKKIFFLDRNSNAYDFFGKYHVEDLKWMEWFCFLWKSAIFLIAIPCVIVFIIT